MSTAVVILALLASSLLGILLVPAALRLAPAKGVPRERAADLLRGGLVIGVLERFAITGGLLAGRPEVVGIVLAIKGLGRYPELRNAASVAGATRTGGPGPAGEQGTTGPDDRSAPATGPGAAQPAGPATNPDTGPTNPDPAVGAAVSERFIIGTLASYIWAGLCGVLAVWALGRWG